MQLIAGHTNGLQVLAALIKRIQYTRPLMDIFNAMEPQTPGGPISNRCKYVRARAMDQKVWFRKSAN